MALEIHLFVYTYFFHFFIQTVEKIHAHLLSEQAKWNIYCRARFTNQGKSASGRSEASDEGSGQVRWWSTNNAQMNEYWLSYFILIMADAIYRAQLKLAWQRGAWLLLVRGCRSFFFNFLQQIRNSMPWRSICSDSIFVSFLLSAPCSPPSTKFCRHVKRKAG